MARYPVITLLPPFMVRYLLTLAVTELFTMGPAHAENIKTVAVSSGQYAIVPALYPKLVIKTCKRANCPTT